MLGLLFVLLSLSPCHAGIFPGSPAFPSAPSPVPGSPAPSSPPPATPPSSNPLGSLLTSLKTSLSTGRRGCALLYSNHRLVSSLPAADPATTYGDFELRGRTKADRSKTLNLLFLTVFASEYLPYFIWANPNLLPSTFSPRNLDPPPFDSAHPAHLEELLSLERSRAAALAKAALSLEARAFSPPLLASVNPFGKAAAQRACESQRSENAALASSLLSPASSLLPPLESRCRSLSPASRFSPATALPEFPLPYLRALSQVLTGGSFLSPYTPAFLLKSQLTAHLKTLAATDDFLLAHSDPAVLSSLSRTDLLELSSARCLGSPALPSPALRSHLARARSTGWRGGGCSRLSAP
ncbi:hypothetical protein TeGR_g10599 [Tetraparma gracilis]|uniref:Uncharacterized protein n=1 Tax=Tetraparma gracilis TaxID=2962635 RepID=A0ABQ6ME24_9STRA|nr:hypothetical protein TeGR_g10599 [Tetraparma gracilis]